jgi:predicted DNA-binding WGR domain protein
MPRYELWSSDSLRFWEFSLTGTKVIERHGERGAKGKSTTKRFPSPDAGRRAYDKLIAEKLAEGIFWPAGDENAPDAGTKAGVLAIRRLDEAARKSSRIWIQFTLKLEDGVATAILDARKTSGPSARVQVRLSDRRPGTISPVWTGPGIGLQLDQIHRRLPGATVLLGTLAVTSRSCPLKPRELASLVTSVLTELFANVEAAPPKAAPPPKRRQPGAAAGQPAGTWSGKDIKTEEIQLGQELARLRFTADGSRLLLLVNPESFPRARAQIQIWAPGGDQPERVVTMPKTPNPSECLAISPDSKHFIAGYQRLRVYEVATGRVTGYLDGHKAFGKSVVDVKFSSDGKYVASASQDETAGLWRFGSEKQLTSFKHEAWVGSVAFLPAGNRLATGCLSHTEAPTSFGGLQSFELNGSKEVQYELPYGAPPYWTEIAVSPDGKFLVAAMGAGKESDAAAVWNLKSGRFVHIIPGARISGMVDAAFTSDSSLLVTSHYKGICVWSTKTWKRVSTIDGCRRMALTADDRFIAYQKGDEVRVRKFERP